MLRTSTGGRDGRAYLFYDFWCRLVQLRNLCPPLLRLFAILAILRGRISRRVPRRAVWLCGMKRGGLTIQMRKSWKFIKFFTVLSNFLKMENFVQDRIPKLFRVVWHLARPFETLSLGATIGGGRIKKPFFGLWSLVTPERCILASSGFLHDVWDWKGYLPTNFHRPQTFLKIFWNFCEILVCGLTLFLMRRIGPLYYRILSATACVHLGLVVWVQCWVEDPLKARFRNFGAFWTPIGAC